MGDELSAMTSSWAVGAGGGKSKRAAASDEDQTTTRSSSASRRTAATTKTTAVKEAGSTAVRMAANAASISSIEGGASTTEATSEGVGAAVGPHSYLQWMTVLVSESYETDSI
jgi:hypothetical protein